MGEIVHKTFTYCEPRYYYQKNQKTVFDRLQKKIKKELDIDATNFKRTYASIWMRKAGAFVWVATVERESMRYEIGSTYTATKLLKSKHLAIEYGGEITPSGLEK